MKANFKRFVLEIFGDIAQYRFKGRINLSFDHHKFLARRNKRGDESDMFFANDLYGKRTYIDDADIRQAYICPVCKYPVIQKRGNIMTHHFAHKTTDICDPWYSGKMSAWHKEMQNLFPRHCQEVIVRNDEHSEYHIADIIFNNGSKSYVVEFQHSTISYNDFVSRTDFYMNQGYGMIWIFDFCDIKPQKIMYYTEIENSDWIQIIWPGKDRLRFLDKIDFREYGEDLQIYFHVNTGKGRKILIEHDDFFDWERWEYINPFQRERLFINLYLTGFYSLKEFFAFPYSEETFYKMLKNTGKNQ